MNQALLSFLILSAVLIRSITAHPSDLRSHGQDDHHVSTAWKRGADVPEPNNATGVDLTSSNENHQAYCNGEEYRTGLNFGSCADALKQIPQSHQIRRFQMRGQGVYDVSLPYRYISGKTLLRDTSRR